jgi:uncharacterized membrane protein YgdD (TMEM256/DUF423 family)
MDYTGIFGSTFSLLSVVFGAFASHLLKKHLSESALQSFEVGVRYLMYHGLALIILWMLPIEEKKWISLLFIGGTLLFSGSIFLLSLQSILNKNLKFLGPVTPIGGTFMILGWILLSVQFIFL